MQWIEWVALWHPFQSAFVFAWGAADPTWLAWVKRVFLLVPVGTVAIGYWTSVLSLPTIIVRHKRRTFVSLLLVTWWDLARAIFTFWGGVFRYLMQLVVSVLGLVQVLLVGTWAIIQEIIALPIRMIRSVGSNVLNPGVPWIASLHGAPIVGNHLPADAEQPRKWGLRHLLAPPPRDCKRLGEDVLGSAAILDPANHIPAKLRVMSLEQVVEPGLRGGVALPSHH